jgi:RNA methyltransferase, TrmH family
MITSTRNTKVQMVRSLNGHAKARREAGKFVIEGVRLVEEAFTHNWLPELVLYSEAISQRGKQILHSSRDYGIQIELVAPQVMKAAADTETPQGILAVLPLKQLPLPTKPRFILILDAMRDPGNLGTILRTAAAAGVQAVLLAPGSADPFAPKVIRSGMGAHFYLPIHSTGWEEISGYLKPEDNSGLKIYLADTAGASSYTDIDMKLPLALIIGGEAEGAGEGAQSLAQERVRIPMPGSAESLNAAVAAGILLFEALRQSTS